MRFSTSMIILALAAMLPAGLLQGQHSQHHMGEKKVQPEKKEMMMGQGQMGSGMMGQKMMAGHKEMKGLVDQVVADLAALEGESDLTVVKKRIAEDREKLEQVQSKMEQCHQMMQKMMERMKSGDMKMMEPKKSGGSMMGGANHMQHLQHMMGGDAEEEVELIKGLDGGLYEPYLPSVVENVQQALQSTGFYESEVDGRLDEATMEAIGKYQREHGIQASGVPSPATRAVLLEEAGASS